MLGNAEITPIIHVEDLDRARRFYTGVLGLSEEKATTSGNVPLRVGGQQLELMVHPGAVSTEATVLSFEVNDLAREIDELSKRGAKFEPVDIEGGKRDGLITTFGNERAAWFKDSEGNWLCLHNGPH